ncbi:hypothetical protein EWS82_13120 [Staphylococcus xylosus]|nr:hypothetical protein [Staphylococcus xylosus]
MPLESRRENPGDGFGRETVLTKADLINGRTEFRELREKANKRNRDKKRNKAWPSFGGLDVFSARPPELLFGSSIEGHEVALRPAWIWRGGLKFCFS